MGCCERGKGGVWLDTAFWPRPFQFHRAAPIHVHTLIRSTHTKKNSNINNNKRTAPATEHIPAAACASCLSSVSSISERRNCLFLKFQLRELKLRLCMSPRELPCA